MPQCVFCEELGVPIINVYVVDTDNHRVRQLILERVPYPKKSGSVLETC